MHPLDVQIIVMRISLSVLYTDNEISSEWMHSPSKYIYSDTVYKGHCI